MSEQSNTYSFTTLDVPDAGGNNANAINNRGEVVGTYSDSTGGHGYIYDSSSGAFTTIDVPNATSTSPTAINNHGEVAGFYSDGTFQSHGFIYDHGTFTTIDAPADATSMSVTAINSHGKVVGSYLDSTLQSHGFIATPTCDPAAGAFITLDDLLASQAGQVSLSDLLPGSAAVSAQSTQGGTSSGAVDDATRANFGGLAFAGIADTTMHVSPSGNT